MTPEEIRIECLKLAHRHDRESAHVVATASEYEKFVTGDSSKQDAPAGRQKLGLPKPTPRSKDWAG